MVLLTEGLYKQYERTEAVRDLNLHVRQGEVYGFLGPNGAGKTTTIMMLLGMVKPTSGKIVIFGEEVKGLDAQLRNKLGVVPEHQSFYDSMTAWEYLSFISQLHGIAEPGSRMNNLLEYFGLWTNRNATLGEYSHGMRQKINICRALLHDPDLLILDEPVLGLDPASVRLVRDFLMSEKEKGKTILISSHLLSEIEKTADRVGIMSEGKLIAEGSIEQVTHAIGEANVLEVELEEPIPEMQATLEKVPCVLNVQREGNRIFIHVDDMHQARSVVSKAIAASGGTILGFKTKERDLEDAFLAITQGDIHRLKEEVG